MLLYSILIILIDNQESRIWETKNLSTNTDSSTDPFFVAAEGLAAKKSEEKIYFDINFIFVTCKPIVTSILLHHNIYDFFLSIVKRFKTLN